MNNRIKYLFLVVILSLGFTTASNLIYSNYEIHPTILISNYNYYYGNTNVERFSIPDDVTSAAWNFQMQSAGSCSNVPVYVYLEHAGYPVVAPLNESFPNTVNKNRLTKTFINFTVSKTNSIYVTKSLNK